MELIGLMAWFITGIPLGITLYLLFFYAFNKPKTEECNTEVQIINQFKLDPENSEKEAFEIAY